MNGPFFTIIYGIYTYLLLTLVSNLFSEFAKEFILPMTLIICGIYLFATVLEVLHPNKITSFLVLTSEVWKGISVYLTMIVMIIYVVGWIINITQEQIFVALITLVPIISIYGLYNADNPKIKNINLEFKNLNQPIRFAHISDVHIGAVRKDRLLNKIVKKINQESKNGLDFVVITGDLADGSGPIGFNSFKPLSKSKVPIFFTSGNHDFYPGIKNVIYAAEEANIRVLSNEIIDIKGTQIIGFPYNNEGFGSNAVSEAADDLNKLENGNCKNCEDKSNKINRDKVSIALHHVPIGWEIFKEHGIELVLAGHTHGGQFFPFNILVKIVFPYLRGLFEDNGKYMFVSDGVGTLDAPIRVGTTAEIAIFNLKRKK